MKTLFRFVVVGLPLILLFLTAGSPTALAATNTQAFSYPQPQPRTQTVLLLNTRYGVIFSQRVLTCNTLQPNYCWYVRNMTRHPVTLDYNGQRWITIQPGKTAGTIYASPGRYEYSIEHSRFAQLMVVVQRPVVNRCGRFNCLGWWYRS